MYEITKRKKHIHHSCFSYEESPDSRPGSSRYPVLAIMEFRSGSHVCLVTIQDVFNRVVIPGWTEELNRSMRFSPKLWYFMVLHPAEAVTETYVWTKPSHDSAANHHITIHYL